MRSDEEVSFHELDRYPRPCIPAFAKCTWRVTREIESGDKPILDRRKPRIGLTCLCDENSEEGVK
jgi:hypothetical protein